MTTQDILLSCHCQRNVLTLTIPSPDGETTDIASLFPTAMVCDCSHCSKRRLIWHFTTLANLEVKKGCERAKGDLKSYRFGSRKLEHQFCPTCGTHMLGGASIDSGNKRASVGVNPATFPGRAHGEAYADVELSSGARDYLADRARHYDHPTQIYAGSCHCKAITFGVLCKPLGKEKVEDCNCSICCGNGLSWIYPGRHDIYIHPSLPSEPWQPVPDLVNRYRLPGTGPRNEHVFCISCGCEVFLAGGTPAVDHETGKQFEGWREDNDNGKGAFFGVNTALLTGMDKLMRHGAKEDEIKKVLIRYGRVYGATEFGGQYEVRL